MPDRQFLIIALAAAAVSFYLQYQQSNVQQQLDKCRTEFQGFKDGLNYAR
jgi:hypothetical protein